MIIHRFLKKSCLMLLIAVALSACSSPLVRLGVDPDDKYDQTQPRQVSGEACGFQLATMIPIRTNSRAVRAYRMLEEEAGKDHVITDVKVTEEWTYALVGTIYCTKMEATAYPRLKKT